MKSSKDLRKSRNAQFKAMVINNNAMSACIINMEQNGFDGEVMAELRNRTNHFIKAMHEYSAYTNCFESTSGEDENGN